MLLGPIGSIGYDGINLILSEDSTNLFNLTFDSTSFVLFREF